MSTMTYAGTPVDVDAEGFMTDPSQWNEQVAAEIAAEAGIGELTDRHWLVVNFMRSTYLESGAAPSIRTLGKASGGADQRALPAVPERTRQARCEANLFFTFFGLDAISRAKHEHVKVATVGNPGLHLATWAGGIPGVSALVTHKLAQEMEKLDIPPIPEFVEMIAESGAGLYACKASVDLFGLTRDEFVPEVEDVITVGEFYDLAAGGQIIFT